MERLEISEEEAAVISEMRKSDRAGRAIFQYAMAFNSDSTLDLDQKPFTIHPTERP